MAGKRKGKQRKSSKKRARPTRKSGARRKSVQHKAAKKPARAGGVDLRAVGSAMHDLTNVATAMRAYLELLETQGALEPRQKYYLDRAQEQVDTLITIVRDLRVKLPQA